MLFLIYFISFLMIVFLNLVRFLSFIIAIADVMFAIQDVSNVNHELPFVYVVIFLTDHYFSFFVLVPFIPGCFLLLFRLDFALITYCE
jgi:hypothetical protein